MKRSLLFALGLMVATAFAGPYDISEFEATDVGAPDDVISAEFGGELTVAPVGEVSSLQEGRLVVRQKFVDPFGEGPTTYQLYQGSAGDLSSMTALAVPEGTDYTDVVKAKFYAGRGVPAEDDIEKAYFDGKSVYVPGQTSVIAFINGSPVELKGDAPAEEPEETPVAAAAPVPADEEECDEYDPDCEEEEDDDSYDVAGNVDETNAYADDRDYAASSAAYDASGENATDRFGIADEVRFWTAVGLSALAATSAVLGVLQHMEANKAQDAYDDLDEVYGNVSSAIKNRCGEIMGDAYSTCVSAMANYDLTGQGYTLNSLKKRRDTNMDTHDSYAMARNIWFGVAGVSLTAAIVLFVW